MKKLLYAQQLQSSKISFENQLGFHPVGFIALVAELAWKER